VAGVGVVLLALGAGTAHAQSSIFGPQTLHGIADVRLSAAGGEASWLDGGFGKTSASGDDDGLSLANAALEWKPRFNFAVSGVVTAELQPRLDPKVDVGEAYLKFRGSPAPWGRVSGRAGLYYPPVSMEHDGVAWTNPDMLTSSAINSWIGEEVKVGGAEATLDHRFGEHEVSATVGVFGWNDTAGTLLTFRGWALHGVKTGANTEFELPPLSAYMAPKQAPETYPVLELDHRAGFYGRLEWRPPAPVVLNATYYDNAGDRIAVQDKQWAWETRFLNVGAKIQVDERTKILAQAMSGETLMGYRVAGGHWVDMGFHAAYLMASRAYGDNQLSARADWFETNDRTYKVADNNDETGWALAAAWRQHLNDHASLMFEALHVSSDRPARVLAGVTPKQDQTVLQSALRLSF
jgi:hypothetical protein